MFNREGKYLRNCRTSPCLAPSAWQDSCRTWHLPWAQSGTLASLWATHPLRGRAAALAPQPLALLLRAPLWIPGTQARGERHKSNMKIGFWVLFPTGWRGCPRLLRAVGMSVEAWKDLVEFRDRGFNPGCQGKARRGDGRAEIPDWKGRFGSAAATAPSSWGAPEESSKDLHGRGKARVAKAPCPGRASGIPAPIPFPRKAVPG